MCFGCEAEMFRGSVQDCFEVPGRGLVVMLTEVDGEPSIGTVVGFLGGHRTIVGIGDNGTDGQPISTRDCLTGRTVPPYCAVVLEWPDGVAGPKGIHGAVLEEISLL